MTKKTQEKTLNIFEEAIQEKKKAYDEARARMQAEKESFEQNINPYDPNDEAETRNEIKDIEYRMGNLDKEFQRDIVGLTIEKKQK